MQSQRRRRLCIQTFWLLRGKVRSGGYQKCKDNTSTRNSRTGQKLNKFGTVTTIELVARRGKRNAQHCVK